MESRSARRRYARADVDRTVTPSPSTLGVKGVGEGSACWRRGIVNAVIDALSPLGSPRRHAAHVREIWRLIPERREGLRERYCGRDDRSRM